MSYLDDEMYDEYVSWRNTCREPVGIRCKTPGVVMAKIAAYLRGLNPPLGMRLERDLGSARFRILAEAGGISRADLRKYAEQIGAKEA